MSRENVEILRRLYAAYNEGDYESALAGLHPDAEMHQAPEIPDTDSYYGRDEFVRGLTRWTREWETFRFETRDFREAPDNEVLVQIRLVGTAKKTGLPSSRDDVFHAWTVRDGKGFRCRVFFDRHRALEAVGLSE